MGEGAPGPKNIPVLQAGRYGWPPRVDDPVNFQSLLPRAAAVFQESSGCAAVLSDPVVIKDWQRSLVLRCRVTSPGSGISSLIIKQIKGEPARGFSDWASLAFLSRQPEAQGIVPRFHGGDPANRFCLMEDLGQGSSLQEILSAGDPAALLGALRALATQMGRLHCATPDAESSFDAIRSALPEGDGLGREREAETWLQGRAKIIAWFEALGCQTPAGFAESLAFIATAYAKADGFLAFTHGDPAPSNNHFGKGGPHLLDFEYGAFRHVLYDITAWNVLCPLPPDLIGEMRNSFCGELAKGFPAARDDTRFTTAWACLSAYRAWAILTWIPPGIIEANRPWADNWGMREAVFVALSRMKECTAPIAELSATSAAADTLLKALRQRWPAFENAEDLLPRWAASEVAP